MSGNFGVTPAGFVLKPVTQILAEYTGDLLALIDPTTDVSTDQPLGQALKIGAKKLGEVWQLAQVAYNATNRGDAEADLLDNIGTLTGTVRAAPSQSAVLCTASFSAPGTYAKGALVAFPASSPTAQFSNAQAIVVPNIGGDQVNPTSVTNTWPWPSGTAAQVSVSLPDMTLTTGGPVIPAIAQGQMITVSGSLTAANNGTFPITSTGAGSVTWTAPPGAATDSGVHISFVIGPPDKLFTSIGTGPDAGDAVIAANAVYLALNANAPFGQLSQKVAVAGWVNVADGGPMTVGTLEELDPAYRVRQWQDLSAPGNDTLDATAAAILLGLAKAPQPPKGASVQMYENTTLTTGVAGDAALPGKAYHVVVYDGAVPNTGQDDPIIAQAIWQNHPAGIQDYGSISVQVADSQGVLRTVNFDRATARNITMGVTVYVSAALFADPIAKPALAAAVVTAIKNASLGLPFTLYGNTVTPGPSSRTTLVPGNDVVAEAFRAIAQGQVGVIDAQPTAATLITAPAPAASGNVLNTILQYGVLATVTCTVAIFVPAA